MGNLHTGSSNCFCFRYKWEMTILLFCTAMAYFFNPLGYDDGWIMAMMDHQRETGHYTWVYVLNDSSVTFWKVGFSIMQMLSGVGEGYGHYLVLRLITVFYILACFYILVKLTENLLWEGSSKPIFLSTLWFCITIEAYIMTLRADSLYLMLILFVLWGMYRALHTKNYQYIYFSMFAAAISGASHPCGLFAWLWVGVVSGMLFLKKQPVPWKKVLFFAILSILLFVFLLLWDQSPSEFIQALKIASDKNYSFSWKEEAIRYHYSWLAHPQWLVALFIGIGIFIVLFNTWMGHSQKTKAFWLLLIAAIAWVLIYHFYALWVILVFIFFSLLALFLKPGMSWPEKDKRLWMIYAISVAVFLAFLPSKWDCYLILWVPLVFIAFVRLASLIQKFWFYRPLCGLLLLGVLYIFSFRVIEVADSQHVNLLRLSVIDPLQGKTSQGIEKHLHPLWQRIDGKVVMYEPFLYPILKNRVNIFFMDKVDEVPEYIVGNLDSEYLITHYKTKNKVIFIPVDSFFYESLNVRVYQVKQF